MLLVWEILRHPSRTGPQAGVGREIVREKGGKPGRAVL
jgi:hypothetical protein